MKLENWNVAQTESCMEENGIVSKITLATYDYFDTKKFIEWIKAYDTEFDMDEYETAIEIHKRETADRDFFRGRSPEQIVAMCNELFNELRNKKGIASSIAIRKRLNIGIDILRGYDIYWTPPRHDNIITEDWSDKLKPVEETVSEKTPEQVIAECFKAAFTDDGLADMADTFSHIKDQAIYNFQAMFLRVLATIDQYWPTSDYHNMCDEAKLLKVFSSVVSDEEFPKLIERLMSLSRSDQRSLIHKMWETADEMYLHDENDKTTKTEDPYKDLPYEGKMVGSVYHTPRDE